MSTNKAPEVTVRHESHTFLSLPAYVQVRGGWLCRTDPRDLHPYNTAPTCHVLKAYVEALTGLSHIHRAGVLNATSLSQSYVPQGPPERGRQAERTFQDQGRGEAPPAHRSSRSHLVPLSVTSNTYCPPESRAKTHISPIYTLLFGST